MQKRQENSKSEILLKFPCFGNPVLTQPTVAVGILKGEAVVT